jgi:DNA-directed RNA polymerase alpha subunit
LALDRLGSLGQIDRMAHETESMNILELGARAYNVLRKLGCRTVADICALTERELLKIHGLGRLTLNDIKGALAKEGLELRG